MKINRLKSVIHDKSNWKENFFLTLFYFCYFYIRMAFILGGIFISFAAIVFMAETLMPEKVHVFNYNITKRVFRELVANGNHHEAISLLKLKPEVMDDVNSFELKTELADCYFHVGDYHLAEQFFLNQYRTMGLTEEQMDEFRKAPEDIQKLLKDIMTFNAAKDLYTIYEKTGNLAGKKEMIGALSEFKDSDLFEKLDSIYDEENSSSFTLNFTTDEFTSHMGLDYMLIKGMYDEEPMTAIDSLEHHIAKYIRKRSYNSEFKLKQINTLLHWEHEHHLYERLYNHLEGALLIADRLNTYKSMAPLGDLSDLCFYVHDMENAERMLNKYGLYIREYYEEEDLEYVLYEMKKVKFMERKGDWSGIEELMERSFGHLRHNIANNLAGMSESQREYYAKELEPNFDEAKRILSIHPSARMARICLENEVFLRGLLLRSATAVANAIRQRGDTLLLQKYQKLIEDKQEMLVREHITGPGNYFRRQMLKREMQSLEEELSAKSAEYNREKQFTFEMKDIRKNMPKDMAFIEFVDIGVSTAALILKNKGEVGYVKLASNDNLSELLNDSPSQIYGTDKLYSMIWEKVDSQLEGISNISYQPSALINRIALDAIRLPDGRYLGESKSLHLISDAMHLNNTNKFSLGKGEKVSLWGGIRYGGDANLSDTIAETREIMRGNRLYPLIYSLEEVRKASKSLDGHSIRYNLYTDSIATERSFKMRSGKGDAILHISTHGFFSENRNNHLNSNPMHNCGIFFAGANRYWTNDSLKVESINEEDGILRAEEVSNLDFSGCKLVILSACETGLGKADSSEGVYGLQRSFKLAGAGNILMSLWAVSDPSTEKLISYFYETLLSGASPYDSLAQAKAYMRNQGAGISEWAGFVLLE